MSEKGYFERLKSNPFLSVAALFTFAGAIVGAANENFSVLNGMIFGAFVSGGISFTLVLLNNIKKR